MGENEQGGMLRTVVVIGIIAMISFVVIVAVLGLKGTATKNTDKGVGAVVTVTKPIALKTTTIVHPTYTPDVSLNSGWGQHFYLVPYVGEIPANSWREEHITVSSSVKIYIRVDISNRLAGNAAGNDFDEGAKRHIDVYKGDTLLSDANAVNAKVWLEPNTDYTFVIKYFNNRSESLYDSVDGDSTMRRVSLITGTSNGEAYTVNYKNFEAATYDNKYAG